MDFSPLPVLGIGSMKQNIAGREYPTVSHFDNGTEYASAGLQNQASRTDMRVKYIQSSNPQQNAPIDQFHRTIGCEWLTR
jgi:putative transposase